MQFLSGAVVFDLIRYIKKLLPTIRVRRCNDRKDYTNDTVYLRDVRFFRTRIRTGSGEMYEEYNFSIMYLPYLTFQKKRGKQ
ncbi:hypothetical protein BWD13_15175 [Leptospira santarosai serovar Grippotyphosa]|nr:Uncharacterized protein XB15_02820 [Leptospira santarosai]ONF84957.1 hypothetical protein BWD13_15175 [Leptospira santarosai serovar Grippotyphosa]